VRFNAITTLEIPYTQRTTQHAVVSAGAERQQRLQSQAQEFSKTFREEVRHENNHMPCRRGQHGLDLTSPDVSQMKKGLDEQQRQRQR